MTTRPLHLAPPRRTGRQLTDRDGRRRGRRAGPVRVDGGSGWESVGRGQRMGFLLMAMEHPRLPFTAGALGGPPIFAFLPPFSTAGTSCCVVHTKIKEGPGLWAGSILLGASACKRARHSVRRGGVTRVRILLAWLARAVSGPMSVLKHACASGRNAAVSRTST